MAKFFDNLKPPSLTIGASIFDRSLYKILAKVLSNRSKSVIGKEVLSNQNVFVAGRHIFHVVLVAIEVTNAWRQRSC